MSSFDGLRFDGSEVLTGLGWRSSCVVLYGAKCGVSDTRADPSYITPLFPTRVAATGCRIFVFGLRRLKVDVPALLTADGRPEIR
eukprot:scaffold9067_cov60-Phaeocystis_antarctica.AAC.2